MYPFSIGVLMDGFRTDTLTALDGTAADFADRYGALCATRL